VTGYLITNLAANKLPLPPKSEVDWWYQYYFSTQSRVLGLTEYRYDLGKYLWGFNSPTWNFSEIIYNQTVAAFNNRDYVSIVIGNYHWRLSEWPSEPEYASIERRLQEAPAIAVPTITIDGEYEHRIFKVGHNVPQEAPRAFARAVVDAGRL
jgi:hypothetical protein